MYLVSVSTKIDLNYGNTANKSEEGKLYILVYTPKCNVSLKKTRICKIEKAN